MCCTCSSEAPFSMTTIIGYHSTKCGEGEAPAEPDVQLAVGGWAGDSSSRMENKKSPENIFPGL
jgi:hypothetical protein